MKKIFSPIQIGSMELKNRVILPAMGTKFVDGKEVSETLINYHVNRVKGGCGLNMVEVASVHSPSAPDKFLSISDDKYIAGLSKLCDEIHNAGGKAGIQLWQGGLAVARDQNARILLPNDMTMANGYTIKAMSKDDINELVDAYGKASLRAVKAGFDCVEIHMGHNYLMHSFLSNGLNHRDDEFGGSLENRMRFPLMVIDEVIKNVPKDFPVFVRIDAHDDYLENGLTIDEVITFLKIAKEHGIKVADVSRGNIVSAGLKYEVPPIDIQHGFNIDNANKIKEATGLIVMGVGRVNFPQLAIDLIEADKIDLIGLGRAQLADPDYVLKMQNNEFDKINYCVGCNQGCYDGFERLDSPHITCLRNPALGLMSEKHLKVASESKKVLIAGGGIAGMLVAQILKLRNHNPIIYEASDHLGGQFLIAGVAPRKEDMKIAMEYMSKQIDDLGIEYHLNTELTSDIIAESNCDIVINAIGASSLIPPFEGVDQANVYGAHDILKQYSKLSGNVVVIGGGMVGMEIAEFVCDSASSVTVLEMQDEVCKDLGHTRKISVMEYIHKDGIKVETSVKVTKITNSDVIGVKDNQEVSYPFDNVVIAIGARSNDFSEVLNYCDDHQIKHYTIGDANKARRAIDATKEAYEVAISIE